jgi:predicted enzyme related to lactoylglutathione lyase
MAHAVSWFQIQGPNGNALQEFYKHVFGWKMKPQPGSGESMMVDAEPGGMAGSVGTSHNHQPTVAVYISVGDIDAVFGKIERGGGRMAMPKMELPGGMGAIAGFTDPANNWIGLWMPGKTSAPTKRGSSAKKPGAKKSGGAKKKMIATRAAKSSAKKAGAKAPAKKYRAKRK